MRRGADLVVTTPPQGPHHSVGRKRLSVGSPLDLADLATRPHLRPQWTWAGVGVSSRIGVAIAGRHAGWVATCPRRTRRWRGRLVLRARQRFAACRGGATLRVSVVSRLLCPGPSDGIVSCVCVGARGTVSCRVPRGWRKGHVCRSAGGLPPAEGGWVPLGGAGTRRIAGSLYGTSAV